MSDVKKEHQKFTGNGVNFKAKLVGIAEVAHPHGDSMCQQTLTSLKESAVNARNQAKEHKKRIIINLTFEFGLRILDERTKATEFQHRMETVAFVCHDAEDDRVFCYIASVGAGKHFLYAVKTAQPAVGAVNGIGELITAIMERNQIPTNSVDPMIMDHQPTSSLSSPLNDDDDDVNVIRVKSRIPSTSSSESNFDEDPQKLLEEDDSHQTEPSAAGNRVEAESSTPTELTSLKITVTEPSTPPLTADTPLTPLVPQETPVLAPAVSSTPSPPVESSPIGTDEKGLDDSNESKQVETFGVEVFIPKKSGSPPKPLNRKKPSLDDDIARFNYGIEFRAKLVGVHDLGGNAGDKMKMSEDALEVLKAELASSKEHKTRISVDVSLEGIRIMEEKSRRLLFFHKVHQLVFIAFDVKEPRGCGYITEMDSKFSFIGIKSMEKSSENLVGALQELIALSFEVKVQQLIKSKQKSAEDEKMIEEMKVRSASYLSMVGLPEESSAMQMDALATVGERDPNEIKDQLESLQQLMDKGDALGAGYNDYEGKIQEHKQGKLNASVLNRFGNKDDIDEVIGKVERVWFPSVTEDKMRVKWLVPKHGMADEFHVYIIPKPEGDAPHEYHVSVKDPPDVTFFGLTPNSIYNVYVCAQHQGKMANPGVGSERTLASKVRGEEGETGETEMLDS